MTENIGGDRSKEEYSQPRIKKQTSRRRNEALGPEGSKSKNPLQPTVNRMGNGAKKVASVQARAKSDLIESMGIPKANEF